jgi:hypothetical protein
MATKATAAGGATTAVDEGDAQCKLFIFMFLTTIFTFLDYQVYPRLIRYQKHEGLERSDACLP